MHRNLLPLLYTVLGLFTLAIVVSLGQPPVAKVPDPVIEPERPEALAEKLGDRDYATREAAMKSLRQMGSAAMPAIRGALKSNNPEVQRRAKELLGQLEYVDKLEPTRVTLQSDGLYLSDALSELAKQTHFEHKVEDQDVLPEKHPLNLQNVTYWEAMDRISTLWKQGITSNDREKSYALSRAYKRSPYVMNSGAFQIELKTIRGTRDYQFGDVERDQDKTEGSLRFDFVIRAEPRFIILKHEPVIWETSVPQSARGVAFDWDRFQGYRAFHHFGGSFSPAQHFSEEFLGNWQHASTVKVLKGTLPIQLLVQQSPVLLTEDFMGSQGKAFQIAGDQFQVRNIGGNHLTVDFELEMNDPILFSSCTEMNRIWLVDRKGHRVENLRWIGSGGGRGMFTLDYSFPRFDPNRAEPLGLMFSEWKIVRHLVPFTFHNVPLP